MNNGPYYLDTNVPVNTMPSFLWWILSTDRAASVWTCWPDVRANDVAHFDDSCLNVAVSLSILLKLSNTTPTSQVDWYLDRPENFSWKFSYLNLTQTGSDISVPLPLYHYSYLTPLCTILRKSSQVKSLPWPKDWAVKYHISSSIIRKAQSLW